MPLYEYGCSSCGSRLERRQRFEDEPLRLCPNCGGTLTRILQPVGIVFKGSGWYSTDNRPTKGIASPGDTSTASTDAAPTTDGKKSEKSEPAAPTPKKDEATSAAKD
jgi:putative FmdB family regulatory protein